MAFAAGGDIVDLTNVRSEAATREMSESATSALDSIRHCSIPVIACVNGDALGGGAELAVACDMRVVASHARIGFIHGRIGITSAWGGGTDLCRLVGPARAMQMMSRCEMVDAEAAFSWGLVNAVVTGSPDNAEARAFLKPLLNLSRRVLQGIKAQTAASRAGLSFESLRAIEREQFVATWLSDEHWTAVDGFLAKKSP